MIIENFKAPTQYSRTAKPIEGTVEDAVARNPLCLLVSASCECGHMWTAPKVGRCPKCHGEKMSVVDVDACMAVRA